MTVICFPKTKVGLFKINIFNRGLRHLTAKINFRHLKGLGYNNSRTLEVTK